MTRRDFPMGQPPPPPQNPHSLWADDDVVVTLPPKTKMTTTNSKVANPRIRTAVCGGASCSVLSSLSSLYAQSMAWRFTWSTWSESRWFDFIFLSTLIPICTITKAIFLNSPIERLAVSNYYRSRDREFAQFSFIEKVCYNCSMTSSLRLFTTLGFLYIFRGGRLKCI